MRKIFAALLLTSLALPSVFGQANSAPPPRPLPTPKPGTENVQAQKSGDSRNIFQRFFGVRPTPIPAPAPAPVVKRAPRPKPKPAPKPAVETSGEPMKKPTAKPAPAVPAPAVPTAPVKPKAGKGGAKKGAPAASVNPADDAGKFRAAKVKAQEDAHIKDLKSKADGEVNEAEAHKALTNYNRALFQKIREVDPSVSDYSGRVEQSMNKRIGSEKKE